MDSDAAEKALFDAARAVMDAMGLDENCVPIRVMFVVEYIDERSEPMMSSFKSRMTPWAALGMLDAEKLTMSEQLMRSSGRKE